jgi:hypothetical protein
MPHFKHADDVIAHLAGLMPNISDPLLEAKYVGFAAVAAVTVYEVAIKNAFFDFAKRKHSILEVFAKAHFERLNGRIKVKMIVEDYLPRFGSKYVERFKRDLSKTNAVYLRQHHRDINSSFSNVITWRNEFAHQGGISSNVTFKEVAAAFEDGKEVVYCIQRSLRR